VKNNLFKVIHIRIYDAIGKLVKDIPVMIGSKGIYEIKWDALNDSRGAVSTGIYFYTVDFGDAALNGKMMLIK
jgi:flagellar hook assembly protein FlgD